MEATLKQQKIPVYIEDEMRQSYMDYAMSVIIGRALPDVRDGLKPVHRRILYAMHDMGNTWNSSYKKSARVVGDVIGKYHPHGDAAAYDTIVRMAQDFSMRHPMVDGQGNFGSIDGDPPAAMRYTEIRMSQLAGEVLADLEKDTVDFIPNYDDSLKEPTVLPSRIPNLLINGAAGIAVGMATNIPPHNLGEVVDGLVAMVENPDISVKQLMKHIPGEKSRSILEALLLEDNFTEETLKNVKVLKKIQAQLSSYINLLAPDEAPLSCDLVEDPEHNCFKLVCTTRANGTGIQTVIDRNFLVSAAYTELKRLFSELAGLGDPPYSVENGQRPARLRSHHELLKYIMEGGKKGQYIQRYKGLGEMNPEQLWETTMNPETRVFLQVRVEDAVEANDIFSILMGDEVEPRRKFIEEHALTAKNLDI